MNVLTKEDQNNIIVFFLAFVIKLFY